MNKFYIASFLSISLGFMCLYANKIQNEAAECVVDVVKNDVQVLNSGINEHKIQLFMYDACPYCVRVVRYLEQHKLMNEIEFIDAGIPENRVLLLAISGRTQAPYLVDRHAGITMPESLDIIAYLSKKFSAIALPSENTMPILVPVKIQEQIKYDSSTFLSDMQASQKPVIILVSTTWCPPCKIFKPLFLEIAQQYADVCEFICIDGDVDRAIVTQLGVQYYPSIVCYKNGKQINPDNYRSKEGLYKLIQQLIMN